MSKYGEPWTLADEDIIDCKGLLLLDDYSVGGDTAKRAILCVNACADMPAFNVAAIQERLKRYDSLKSQLDDAMRLCKSALTHLQDPSSIDFDSLEMALDIFLSKHKEADNAKV